MHISSEYRASNDIIIDFGTRPKTGITEKVMKEAFYERRK